MIISHKYKFIFIKTQKTAGTSIEQYLSEHCLATDVLTPIYPPIAGYVPRNYAGYFNPFPELLMGGGLIKRITQCRRDLMAKRRFYNHMPAWKVKARVASGVWNTYFKFCVERNPWDKVLSAYHMQQHRLQEEISFDSFLSAGHLCYNYHLYTAAGKSDELLVDHVVRYENLNEELDRIFARLGIPFQGVLTAKAKTSYRKDRRHYSDIYTPQQADIVRTLFSNMIGKFEYEF